MIDELKDIKSNPYKYICNYAEEVLPSTGKDVFTVLALQPPSLIIPPFLSNGSSIRSNINCFFLAPAGSGKSTISRMFMDFAYEPIFIKSITSAELYSQISKKKDCCTLIVDDFAQLSRDIDVIKILESSLGEEKKINRRTRTSSYDEDVNVCGLLCGVPLDLNVYLSMLSGLIFRCAPISIVHNIEEHSLIGDKIANGIGKDHTIKLSQAVKNFYIELAKVQAGENKDIKPIVAYNFKTEHLQRSKEEWKSLSNSFLQSHPGFSWFREYFDFIRFMIAHAFMNVFNGRATDGVLTPNDEDFNVAFRLMIRSIRFKYRLIHSDVMANSVRSSEDFYNIMNSKIPSEEEKQYIRAILSKSKKSRRLNI